MIKVEFKGGKEMEAALMELKIATGKSVVRRVLKKAGEPIAERASAGAPVEKGHLAKSYVVGTQLNKRAFAQAKGEGRDDVFMYIGTNNPNGTRHEFGTYRHKAHPHFRPAWDSLKGQTLDFINENMMAEIGKAVTRARSRALKG